jgi:Protein of unknown function (DUF992)
MVITQR